MIKLCFIGAGNMAKEHLKVFSKKKILLSGVFTRTICKAKILKKSFKSLKIYQNLDEMLIKEKPDGVIVAVNEDSLIKILNITSKYNCPLLIEKPIGYNFNNSLRILKIIKEKKIKNYYVALNRRYYKSTQKLINLLNKNNAKRKIYINDQQYNLRNYYPSKSKKVIKNMMFANSVHLVDYINICARGRIKTISNEIKIIKKKISYVKSKIYFSSGDLVFYKAIWNSFSKWGVRIFTSKYFYELSPLETLKYFNFNKKKKISYNMKPSDINFKPGFLDQANDFINMIKNKPHSLINVKDNFYTTKLIHNIYRDFYKINKNL